MQKQRRRRSSVGRSGYSMASPIARLTQKWQQKVRALEIASLRR